jgi:hypothetical protein
MQEERVGGGLFQFASPLLKGAVDQRHASAALCPRKTCTHCTGDWVGLGDVLERHRKSHFHWDSVTEPSSL